MVLAAVRAPSSGVLAKVLDARVKQLSLDVEADDDKFRTERMKQVSSGIQGLLAADHDRLLRSARKKVSGSGEEEAKARSKFDLEQAEICKQLAIEIGFCLARASLEAALTAVESSQGSSKEPLEKELSDLRDFCEALNAADASGIPFGNRSSASSGGDTNSKVSALVADISSRLSNAFTELESAREKGDDCEAWSLVVCVLAGLRETWQALRVMQAGNKEDDAVSPKQVFVSPIPGIVSPLNDAGSEKSGFFSAAASESEGRAESFAEATPEGSFGIREAGKIIGAEAAAVVYQ